MISDSQKPLSLVKNRQLGLLFFYLDMFKPAAFVICHVAIVSNSCLYKYTVSDVALDEIKGKIVFYDPISGQNIQQINFITLLVNSINGYTFTITKRQEKKSTMSYMVL